MGRTVNVSGAAVKGSQGTAFAPLPAGKYNVSVFDLAEGEYKNGVNKGKKFLKLQLRISEGQTGTNRRVFTNVGDFERWNPKAGKEVGAVNFQYFQFYKALGVVFPKPGEDGEVELPDFDEIEGADLAIKLKIVEDSYAYEKALGEWKDAKDKAEAKGKPFEDEEPVKGDFLKNEVAEFLPSLDEDELASAGGDDDFDL